MFPARRRICLDCRAALPDGAACTWLTHEHDDLTGACARLIERVWGEAREVDQVRPWDLLVPGSWRSVVVRERDRPLGAATAPMVPITAVGFRGRIEQAATAPVPLGDQRGVGFAVEVRHAEAAGSPIMLRDGATVGFTIAADDGRLLVVPPGGLRMPEGVPGEPVKNRPRIEGYLRGLAPDAGLPSPFPWDEVSMAVLAPGDAVTVRAVASVRPDPRGTTAYREAPRSILMASGAVWVEVLD